MKKLLFIVCLAAFAACNNAGSSETKTDSSIASTAAPAKKTIPDLPYQLKKPYKNWQPGDPQHALTVMKSLKAWENGDIAKSMEGFADSVEIYFDDWSGKFSRDSVAKAFTRYRNTLASVNVQMEDWESVISEDGSTEYVTLWYKQVNTDKKGKTDSVDCVNDAKMVNGKIASLSEAIRHYPKK